MRPDRAFARQPRHLEVDVQVLLERLLVVEREHADAGLDHLGLEAGPLGPERDGEIALRVDVDTEHLLASLRGQQAERGRDGGLAGSALAGNEDDAPLEQFVEEGRRRS